MLLERSVSLISPPGPPSDSGVDVERATQAASYLLGLSQGRMPFGRLMLMLYLGDREALLQRGRPITFDAYAATPLGPVPISVVRFILGPEVEPTWQRAIQREGSEDVVGGGKEFGRLSKHDRSMLDLAHQTLDALDVLPTLERIQELCPEWLENLGLKIPISAILVQGGESAEDAMAIDAQIAAERRVAARRDSYTA